MRMELYFTTLPVFLLVLVQISLASVNSCCRFKHLDHCQVFSWDGTSYCSQEKKPGSVRGCPMEDSARTRVSAHITDINVKYQIDRCLNQHGSSSAGSCPKYQSHGFITLNVSFALGSPDFTGILFQVVSLRNAVGVDTCHYVYLNDSLSYHDVIEDKRAKKFYFAGFDEVFKPRSKFIIYIRVLPVPRNGSLNRISHHSVSIPDCNHLPDDVYFCSLPSAAKWVSNITTTVLEDQGSVNVSFTINNNTGDFTDYELKLWSLPENETVERRLVKNNKDHWHCDDQDCVMHEAFDVSAGDYYVTVQGNRNGWSSSEACREDPYRVQKECRIAYSAKFVVEAIISTMIATSRDTSSVSPSAILSTESTTVVTKVDVPTADQWSLHFLVMVVAAVAVAVITCFGAPFCVWRIWKHRYHHHCPFGNDEITVIDEQWGWEHKTLIVPPYQGHGVTASSKGGLSTGDLTECQSVNGTSTSVSGNLVSQCTTYVPLRRHPPGTNQVDAIQRMGLMGGGLPDYNSLQSEEPDLSHSDEGYSDNGVPISPDDDWQERRHPADRQDSGISMHHPTEIPDGIAAISQGNILPDREQHSFKHLNGEKCLAPAERPLSEKVTGKVTTV